MKRIRIIAISMALVLSLAAVVFAVGRVATKTVANSATSCCTDNAACCKNGSCCASKEDCPLKQKSAAAQTVAQPRVTVEDASAETNSCDHNKTANAANDCCGNGAACCNGGSCCKSKTKTTASL